MRGRRNRHLSRRLVGALLIPLFSLLAMPSALLAQSGDITFHKDIEPILQANCQACHRPGGAGPMPLLTYEQVAPFAGLIEYKTGLRDQAGAMPPWSRSVTRSKLVVVPPSLILTT